MVRVCPIIYTEYSSFILTTCIVCPSIKLVRLKNTPVVIDFPDDWMSAILTALNDEHPIRRGEMRRLVEAWQESDRDAAKLMRKCPELKPYLYDKKGKPRWLAIPICRGSGFQVMVSVEGPPHPKTDLIRDEARLMFLRLLLNPLRDRLSEHPCARARCGKYFLKTTASNTVYCSRKCNKADTARSSREQTLEKERVEKLKRATAAATEWLLARTTLDWKRWVAKRHPDITLTFLTQAVNNKKLSEPRKDN
jgi:hypothetical protein